jgi:hypothetical protein
MECRIRRWRTLLVVVLNTALREERCPTGFPLSDSDRRGRALQLDSRHRLLVCGRRSSVNVGSLNTSNHPPWGRCHSVHSCSERRNEHMRSSMQRSPLLKAAGYCLPPLRQHHPRRHSTLQCLDGTERSLRRRTDSWLAATSPSMADR